MSYFRVIRRREIRGSWGVKNKLELKKGAV